MPERGRFVDPAGIAIDREEGVMYVIDERMIMGITKENAADAANITISRVEIATGAVEDFVRFLPALDCQAPSLRGLAVDPSGEYLYAAVGVGGTGDFVTKLSPSLTVLGHFGQSGLEEQGTGSWARPGMSRSTATTCTSATARTTQPLTETKRPRHRHAQRTSLARTSGSAA